MQAGRISLVPYIGFVRHCFSHDLWEKLMISKTFTVAYSKDLTRRKLSVERLDQLAEHERKRLEQARLATKPSKPQVQMSIRMTEDAYLRYRALCKSQNKTNGDMVLELMQFYLNGNGVLPTNPV